MAHVLIVGCGYIGTALGLHLAAAGHTVRGMRRQPRSLPAALHPLEADVTIPDSLRDLPRGIEVVFYTAAAKQRTDEAYCATYVTGLHNLLVALQQQQQHPRRIVLTSSTGVYAQCQGEWVDETSPTEPTHFAGQRLLEGERLLQESPFASTVLRLAGIYGPGRTRLLDSVRQGTAVAPTGATIYLNLIHRDDCVGALQQLMQLDCPAPVYLGVDHAPTDRGVVLQWLAAQLGVPAPAPEPVPEVQPQSVRSNKRCSNARLVAAGYTFRYRSFRDGYTALLSAREACSGESGLIR